jgi:hypothetical protein
VRRAAFDAVRVLRVAVVGLLGRHVGGAHALGAQRPAGARVGAVPGTAAADAQQQLVGPLRVGQIEWMPGQG